MVLAMVDQSSIQGQHVSDQSTLPLHSPWLIRVNARNGFRWVKPPLPLPTIALGKRYPHPVSTQHAELFAIINKRQTGAGSIMSPHFGFIGLVTPGRHRRFCRCCVKKVQLVGLLISDHSSNRLIWLRSPARPPNHCLIQIEIKHHVH